MNYILKLKFILLPLMLIYANPLMAQFSGNGEGTQESPYLITNADQLSEVRNNLTAHYKVLNDIDLTDWIAENNPTAGWAPIGKDSEAFSGEFDGNNKRIKGLFINKPTINNIGFFNSLAEEAHVHNLILVSPNITGANYVGGIAGTSKSAFLSNCHLCGGSVSGSDYVGGIVGQLYGIEKHIGNSNYLYANIDYCSSSANVNGSKNVGGICGYIYSNSFYNDYNRGNITNCLSSGLISGNSEVGGIIGQAYYNRGGYDKTIITIRISKNIFTGSIEGESNVNGILGYALGTTEVISSNVSAASEISSNEIAHRISGIGGADNIGWSLTKIKVNDVEIEIEEDSNNGVSYGLSTLHHSQIYSGLGFDFENYWAIEEGKGFPYLKELGEDGNTSNNDVSSSIEIPSSAAVVYVGSSTPVEISADLSSILGNRTIIKDNYNALMFVNDKTVTETMNLLGDSSAENKIFKDDNGAWKAESICLTDAEPVFIPANVNAEEINYTRNFVSTAWQPLYLPFNMNYEDWADKADIAYINNVHQFDEDNDGEIDRTVLEFITIKTGNIEANIPYVIRPKQSGEITFKSKKVILNATPQTDGYVDCMSTRTKYTLYGTYQEKADIYDNGLYAMVNGCFKQAESANVTLSPFRIYLDIESRTNGSMQKIKRMDIVVDGNVYDASGVQIITIDDSDNETLYNIYGQKVDKNYKGIVIKNGKKYINQ